MRYARHLAVLLGLLIESIAVAQAGGVAPSGRSAPDVRNRYAFAETRVHDATQAFSSPLAHATLNERRSLLGAIPTIGDLDLDLDRSSGGVVPDSTSDDDDGDVLDSSLPALVKRIRPEVKLDLAGDLRTSLLLDIRFASTVHLVQLASERVDESLNGTPADTGLFERNRSHGIPTATDPRATTADRAWNDTRRDSAGLQWTFADSWRLSTGFGYGNVPIDDKNRLPDIPVGDQYRFSIGLQHDFGGGKVLGASYTLLYSPIDGILQSPSDGAGLGGQFDPSLVHVFGVTFGLAF